MIKMKEKIFSLRMPSKLYKKIQGKAFENKMADREPKSMNGLIIQILTAREGKEKEGKK